MENEDNESGYEAGSQVSLPSSDITDSNISKRKPCDICGSGANYNLIVTCIACRETREHTYCMKVLLRSVPPMWLCEKCRTGVRVIHVAALHNEAVHQNITSDSSNQLSGQVDDSSPVSMDTSPELPELNLVQSDSESAN